MLFYLFLAISQLVLSVSSFTSYKPKLSETNSSLNIFSKGANSMHHMQPNVRPLKPSNHRLMNIQQMNTLHRHETPRLLEHYTVHPNYYNPWNPKAKLYFPQQQRLTRHSSESHIESLPIERSSFNNQIPRPPRLTRTMSENHRKYIDSVVEQPRPFNFPLEGPAPSEFKKTKDSKKENSRKKTKKINNIQDILMQEESHDVNPYQMPVGIHISGSFKNLQKSGISNAFRRYIQLQPQPQPSPSQLNYQRIAFDPFYPYKPKSLNDINSLAMQQLSINRTKKKKKNKKNVIAPTMVFQPSGQRPVSSDMFFDALRINNSMNALGSQRNLKHEPFSLKLEVYPIRSGKKAPLLPLTANQFMTTVRPPVPAFEPFQPAFGMPIENGVNYLNYMNNPQRFKPKFVQPPIFYPNVLQRDKIPSDSNGLASHPEEVKKPSEKEPKSISNQLMVHLNVFPSKKETTNPPQSHLYDVIHADVHDRSSFTKNDSSTYTDCETSDKLFDDEADSTELYEYKHHHKNIQHPSVKPEVNEQKHDEIQLSLKSNVTSNPVGNDSEKSDQKFSTFRFPVENLLQFQANDAVI